MTELPTARTASVVISAYTLERWPLTKQAVESSRDQTAPVEKVVLCIDDNADLLARARSEWQKVEGTPVEVIMNSDSADGEQISGSASARNAGAARVTSDIVVFLDDDARPERDWIAQLMAVYEERPAAVAVGGAPLPVYETTRPDWYPANFDWVFGCVYAGLPETVAPLARLIGANLSVRRGALEQVGGFGTNYPIDDLELCIKLADTYGPEALVYTPNAIVHHFVPAQRLTWAYFRQRCYSVNRAKAHLFRRLGSAASLAAERAFVIHTLRHQLMTALGRGLARDPGALRSLAAMFAGIGFAGAGRCRGLLDQLTAPGASL
jgi:cellulose synthase/poly-beta-1,6-N-acetylglucosamine synthase-like glycosyltransferase